MALQIQILSHNVGLPVLIAAAVLLLGLVRLLRVGRRDKRLPPGPPTLPIIGNLHQIPITGMYKKFKEWGDQYGGVFSLKMGPATTIVLYDRKAVHDLLDKKGAIYSERHFDYVASLVTGGDSFAFMHNTPLWRSQRKVASHNLSPRMLDENVQPLQEAEVAVLLSDLVQSPADFYHHIQRTTASVSNIFIWGHRGVTYEDFWGSCVYKALEKYSTVLEPGANPPVDQFPFLRYLPDFLSSWKLNARQSYKAMDDTWSSARARVDARRAKGDKRNCIIDRIIDGDKALDITLTDKQLNHFLGVLVEGGAETTAASVLTSLLQLVQYPEIQKKAQKEIDAVCGSDRSPLWSDFQKLPYINCIVKEGMRWHPVIPLGVPHRVNQDDWYNGMLIPKDSTVMIPVWAMHFSENHGYEDPNKYNPDRWLKFPRLASELAGVSDYNQRAHHYGYGAGRRVCPGMHMAERSQWRITAKILWAFDIVAMEDPDTGKPYTIDPEAYHEGLVHCPKPYKATFRPRSKAHLATVAAEAAKAREFLREYE